MDILTLTGLILGMGVVYYVMLHGKITALLFNFDAFLLVFGGTFASTMVTYHWDVMRRVPRALLFIFFPPKRKSISQVIEQLIKFQTLALSQGIDALAEEMGRIDDEFLKSGIKMLIERWQKEI